MTVEVQPVLIEKPAAVSDGTGSTGIENLRPGIHAKSVLTGSAQSCVKAEASGAATVSINADMRVGALEETITVTGESPVVDLQSASDGADQRCDQGHPTAGSYNALLVLVMLFGGQQM